MSILSLSRVRILVISLMVIILTVTGIFIALNAKKSGSDSKINGLNASPRASSVPVVSGTDVSLIKDAGVAWLTEPKQLADLKLFTTVSSEGATIVMPEVKYYKVGTDSGQDIIMALLPPDGPSSDNVAHLLKKSDGSYELLLKHSTDILPSDNGYAPNVETIGSVTKNTTKTYAALVAPKSIDFKGVALESGFSFINLFSDYKDGENISLTEVSKTAYGPLYSRIQKAQSNSAVGIQTYVLRLANGTAVPYQSSFSFIADDYKANVTWKNGSKNTDTYRVDGTLSCGSPTGIAVVVNGSLDGMAEAGTTNKGEKVYEYTNPEHPVMKYFYEPLNGFYYKYGTGDPEQIPITASEYLQKHGVFAYKDSAGRVVLFANTVYGLNAECGKPVVYLYPTQTSQVSVKVDADITISDPEYGNGWNVIAEPSGKLTNQVDGQTYDSLFWEGTGKNYPAITEGFVVARQNIEPTLRSHLTRLGLNQKESQDFLDFWLPKMPTTPYIRLTWFGTRAMNALAPLTIVPKPDTVIRIFLDFEGLNKQVSLPEQHLGTINRSGFTAVEWGGLLRK